MVVAEKAVRLFVLGTPSLLCSRSGQYSLGVNSSEQASVKDENFHRILFQLVKYVSVEERCYSEFSFQIK